MEDCFGGTEGYTSAIWKEISGVFQSYQCSFFAGGDLLMFWIHVLSEDK